MPSRPPCPTPAPSPGPHGFDAGVPQFTGRQHLSTRWAGQESGCWGFAHVSPDELLARRAQALKGERRRKANAAGSHCRLRFLWDMASNFQTGSLKNHKARPRRRSPPWRSWIWPSVSSKMRSMSYTSWEALLGSLWPCGVLLSPATECYCAS